MTKIDTKTLTNISAYLDGELNENEKLQTEEELQKSASLRETINDYKLISTAASSLPPLQEDISFESRLFSKLNEKRSSTAFFDSYRKPAIAFASLCILFMAIYNYYPGAFSHFLDTKKQELLSLTNNLKPLLFATNLTKDDIFDFAFNKQIPINKDSKQVIQLGTNASGEEFLEVKNAEVFPSKFGYTQFVSSLKLKPEQVKQVDKILEKYSDKIASAVLVNDKNTVAINSQIWDFHNQLRQELVDFANNANPTVCKSVMPLNFSFSASNAGAQSASLSSDMYYCISPDSFFTTSLNIDKAQLLAEIEEEKNSGDLANTKEEIKRVKIEFKNTLKDAKKNLASLKNIEILNHGSKIKIHIPDAVSPDVLLPGIDQFTFRLDSVFKNLENLSLAINVTENGKKNHIQLNLGADDNEPADEPVRGNPMTVSSSSNSGARSSQPKQVQISRVPLQFNLDSLMQIIRAQTDSVAASTPKQLDKKLNQFKKEIIDNINKELKKLNKDANKKGDAKSEEETGPVEL